MISTGNVLIRTEVEERLVMEAKGECGRWREGGGGVELDENEQ